MPVDEWQVTVEPSGVAAAAAENAVIRKAEAEALAAQEEKEQLEAREAARHRAGQRTLDMLSEKLSIKDLKKHLAIAPKHVIDYQNDTGVSPLFACCWNDLPEHAKVFLEAGCIVDSKNSSGYTPMMIACSVGKPETVQMLLDHGAYVNVVTPDGDTACGQALNHPTILRLLLEAGADRSIKKMIDGVPTSLLDQARGNHGVGMWKDNRAVSAQILREYDQIEMLQKVAERRALEPPEKRLGPQMFEAAKAGKLDELNKMIVADGDVTWADEKKRSSLWIACKMGRYPCAALLLQSNALVDQFDEDGATPLHAASAAGKKECVELCLDRGARINATNSKGFTPLISAIYARQPTVALYLIERGANVHMKAQGKTAMEYAKIVVRAAPTEAAKQLVSIIQAAENNELEAMQQMGNLMQGMMGGQGRYVPGQNKKEAEEIS